MKTKPNMRTFWHWRRERHGGRLIVAALALGLIALTAGTGAASAAPALAAPSGSPITICEVSAQSGAALGVGLGDKRGITAYTKWINSHGGVLGHPYKLVALDDASTPSVAVSDVRKCVTQIHANFILGPGETNDYVAAVPVANSLKTILIMQGAGWSGIGIPTNQLTSYSFPGLYNAYQQNDLDMVKKIIVPRHYKRVAVIDGCDPLCDTNTKFMKQYGKQYGFKVVASEKVTYNQTDDAPQVIKLLSAHPQAIVLGIPPGQDTVTFLKALRAQNPTIPVGECAVCTLPSFVHAVGGPNALKNVYVLGDSQMLVKYTPSKQTRTSIDDYVAGMKAVGFGSVSNIAQDLVGWATGEELTDGIRKAHSTSTEAVKTALQHQHLNLLGWSWARTPHDYEILSSYHSVMAIWTPQTKLKVYNAS